MTSPLLDPENLARAAVDVHSSFAGAARELCRAAIGAIAVLDADRVVGMVTEDDLLRGLFPGYLDELRHTSFVEEDSLLGPHLDTASSEPVSRHMRPAEIVELPTSALDVAQRFLHSPASALIAVRDGRFAGVIDQTRFCNSILGRYGWER